MVDDGRLANSAYPKKVTVARAPALMTFCLQRFRNLGPRIVFQWLSLPFIVFRIALMVQECLENSLQNAIIYSD